MRTTFFFTALWIGIGSVTAGTDAPRPTRIAPQQLAQALQTLVKDRDIQLVYRSELVGELRTKGADGVLTLEEALTLLLRDSGLGYRYLDEDAITLVSVSH